MFEERARQMRFHGLDQATPGVGCQVMFNRLWPTNSPRSAGRFKVFRVEVEHRTESGGPLAIFRKSSKDRLAIRRCDGDGAVGRAKIQAHSCVHRILTLDVSS